MMTIAMIVGFVACFAAGCLSGWLVGAVRGWDACAVDVRATCDDYLAQTLDTNQRHIATDVVDYVKSSLRA